MLLNPADEHLAFAVDGDIRKIIVHDANNDVLRHVLQVERFQFLNSDGISIIIAKFFPLIRGRREVVFEFISVV